MSLLIYKDRYSIRKKKFLLRPLFTRVKSDILEQCLKKSIKPDRTVRARFSRSKLKEKVSGYCQLLIFCKSNPSGPVSLCFKNFDCGYYSILLSYSSFSKDTAELLFFAARLAEYLQFKLKHLTIENSTILRCRCLGFME